MYMEKVLEIGKAENGFVISCNVPIKEDKKGSKDMPRCCDSENKMYLAKDILELATMVNKLVPLLDMDFKSEDEFDAAFDEAAGEKEED